MNIYTEVTITPHHAGFGMYQRGEIQSSPTNSYAFESDLLDAITQNSDAVLPLAEALESPDFQSIGIENIDGKIYNQPNKIYARIDRGQLSYFGIVESEVAQDFFSK